MPPLIVVTTSSMPEGDGRPGRATLNRAYLRALEQAGAAPLLLAPESTQATIGALMSLAQGLVLTGGGDVFPGLYGEEPHPATAGVSAGRDRTEVEALGIALERGIPVLAICRGMQVLNVALGGTLCQDLPSLWAGALNHAQTNGGAHRRDEVTHDVVLQPGSCLAGLFGAGELQVNSMHHQALARMADGLTPVGWTSDGVVEAAEMPGEHWVFAVQWHPEELYEGHEHARRLFSSFIAATSSSEHDSSTRQRTGAEL